MPKFDAYYKWLGIPPSEQPPHHYRLLGITPFESDADVIDAAADRQMSFLRDCGNGPNLSESQRLLNQVSEARITLLNAAKKAAYDQTLRQKLAPAAPPVAARAVVPKPAVAKPAEPFQINTGSADRRPGPAGGSSRWLAIGGALVAVIVLAVVASQFVGGGPSVAVNTTPSPTPNPQVPAVTPAPQPRVEPPKAETKVQPPKTPEPPARPVEAPKKPPESDPEPQSPNTTSKTATPAAPPDEPPPAREPPASSVSKEPKKEFDPLLPRQVDPTKSGEKRPAAIDEDEPAQKPPVVVAQADPPAKEPKTERLPVPDRPAMQAAEKLIKDLFKSEYTSKKPEDRSALAKKLLAQGKDSPDDPAARYVLFHESREVAVSIGDAETALAAFRETARLFDVNRADEEAGLLSALANKVRTPEAAKLVIDAAVALIDSSIASDDYESAKRALALASASARKTQNVALITQLASRTREIDQLKRDFAGAQAAQEKLKTSPDDAEANLTLGKFYAFGKGDFERGLPYLAKGSDEQLAELVKREAAKPKDPTELAEIGDAWWTRGEKLQDASRDRINSRALYWYQLALQSPELKGLARTRLEQRVTQNSAIAPQSPAKLALELHKKYRFYAPGGGEGGFFINFRGKGEKNLRAKVSALGINAGEDPWYYLMPDGTLYERYPPYHNGPTSPLTGKAIAKLSTDIYAKPSLLYEHGE